MKVFRIFCLAVALCVVFLESAMSNKLTNHEFVVDELYRAENVDDFKGEYRGVRKDTGRGEIVLTPKSGVKSRIKGDYYSEPVKAEFPFHEILPSWNMKLNEASQGYRVSIRMAREDMEWSPWLHFGAGGTLADPKRERKKDEADGWGVVDVDYLMLENPAHYFQYRIELQSRPMRGLSGENRVGVKAFYVSYSNTAGDKELHAKRVTAKALEKDDWSTTVAMPYRSQLWVTEKGIRGSICCPTCVSMVLEGYGVDKKIATIARHAWDEEHRIYGAWPRAVQTAARHGMKAWVDRFRTHDSVRRALLDGIPLMASIRVKRGELSNVSYRVSGGHLILIRGLTADGDYVVNDPYCPGPDGAEIVFTKEDIEKVWFNKGGVGIVIIKPEKQNGHSDRRQANN